MDAEVAGYAGQAAAVALSDGAEFPLAAAAVELSEDHGGFGGGIFGEVVAGQFGAVGLVDDADIGVVGPMSRSAVATLVERRSRLLRLVHLPEGHASAQLVAALTAGLAGHHPDRLLTLAWDQGSEMAAHDKVAKLFREGVYFADPGCPWMRGTNENTVPIPAQGLGPAVLHRPRPRRHRDEAQRPTAQDTRMEDAR